MAYTLPQFLCELCSADLKKFHLFIEKAIESHNILETNLQNQIEAVDIKSENEQEIECVYMIEPCYEGIPTADCEVEAKTEIEFMPEETNENIQTQDDDVDEQSDGTLTDDVMEDEDYIGSNAYNKEVKKEDTISEVKEEKPKKAKSQSKLPAMCSYCSKIIHNASYLRKHEQTHMEYRERDVTCPECGLKTYSKKTLYAHMKIHDKNRERNFKCEFCDKAFFNRGACNVHRKKHLDDKMKCPLCPKEYYRRVDLDRHIQTHSHAPLHSDKPKSKLKYFIHCKECNQDIVSHKFTAHRAKHLNEPLMRCKLCEKDFFCRISCTRHMKRVHKKTYDNYDDITIYYEKYRARLPHALLLQQGDMEAKECT
ncbi:zinc finger protein 33B-like [Musca vetustissima]|uniref:zinc finger protein 33B-like n=1 Tax=Musca vetustissima TaxID=27455 RepID=UPI002AB6024C|nr:zinc finger protein 33B-like [Musca vetustissima]